MEIDNEAYDFIDNLDGYTDNDELSYADEHQYDDELEHDYSADDECMNDTEKTKSPTILAEDTSIFKSPLTPMPYADGGNENISVSDEDNDNYNDNDSISNIAVASIHDPIHVQVEAVNKCNEVCEESNNFKYQQELRIYVNRCMFIRNTSIGKRVGFAPSIPRITEFIKCWNCDDWIPPHTSPICIPLCSQTHMHSKYVFEKMLGYFCSWGCCKKYIFETMSERNKTKYMRSLLQFRRIFFPNDSNKPIQMSASRTCTTLYGGPTDPEKYYSKIDKVNLPPLAEDILNSLNKLSL